LLISFRKNIAENPLGLVCCYLRFNHKSKESSEKNSKDCSPYFDSRNREKYLDTNLSLCRVFLTFLLVKCNFFSENLILVQIEC